MTDESAMVFLEDAAPLVLIATDSTVSRTILKGEGLNVVLFSFDAGQELSEHTAAMPVNLQVLQGRLQVTADDQTVELRPGGIIHLRTRVPHTVLALEPSLLMLTMITAARA